MLPCIESYQKVDLRTITLGVPPQEVLTKDSVTVSVDAVVYYRVSNATVSVANVENAHHSTRLVDGDDDWLGEIFNNIERVLG